jgi:hypothetical protein
VEIVNIVPHVLLSNLLSNPHFIAGLCDTTAVQETDHDDEGWLALEGMMAVWQCLPEPAAARTRSHPRPFDVKRGYQREGCDGWFQIFRLVSMYSVFWSLIPQD